ncbi:MAG: hypothetical protein AAFO69_08000 [Bacteroidota bacterium]
MRKILFLYFLLFSFVAQEAPISQLCASSCETEVIEEVENAKKAEEYLSHERTRVGQRPTYSYASKKLVNVTDRQLLLADQSHQIAHSVRKHLYHMQFLI